MDFGRRINNLTPRPSDLEAGLDKISARVNNQSKALGRITDNNVKRDVHLQSMLQRIDVGVDHMTASLHRHRPF